jgi:hypothetical protein
MLNVKNALIAAALLLSGCATANLPAGDRLAALDLQDEVTLSVQADVKAGRSVQSLVNALTPSDVDHMEFVLLKNVNGSFIQVGSLSTPNGSGVSKTVNFAHLKMNTTYKVAATCIGTGGANLNKADGSGVATVTTTNDNYVPSRSTST